MRVSDFSYDLPEERIAYFPPKQRGSSRLLVVDRATKHFYHRKYPNLVDYLSPGDVLILNNTRVIKARLLATNNAGKARELLLLENHHTSDLYKRKVLYKGTLRPGEQLDVAGTEVKIDEILSGGLAVVSSTKPLLELAEEAGTVPLPPYLHRQASEVDSQRYQTVFASSPGSVAAPTASLNFTTELQEKLQSKGVHIAYLTLHVGLGTFLPIRSNEIEQHRMHSEYFEIPAETVEIIQRAKQKNHKIVALGTTVARTLEYAAEHILDQMVRPLSGEADIFIYPGYKFKLIDGLLTNFHAPKSTVLMLTAAFAGWDTLQAAYQDALKEKYTFLSYGDSMLII